MSGDTFLGRWSRLKRAERVDEPDAAPSLHRKEGAAAPDVPPDVPLSSEDAPAIAPEALPRIEELTPESDISAFLKKGVPQTLKAAALRRVWSLDPAIRDYVGPAEYAWDFNDPAAMHGFGGGSAMEEVGRAVRSLSGSDRAGDPPAPATSPSPLSAEAAPTPPGRTVEDRAEPAQNAAPATADAAGGCPQAETAETASDARPDTPEPAPKRGPGRRHGSAIPT